MATINFLYRSLKSKAPLIVRLLFRHNNTDYTLGAKSRITVEKDYWENKHTQKKKDLETANKQVEINGELNKIENYIIEQFNRTETRLINKSWLEATIERYYNPTSSKGLSSILSEYLDIYVNFKKNDIKASSVQKFNVNKQMLLRFQESTKLIYHIKDVDLQFKQKFEEYCINNNYSINTIARAIRYFKTVCKHAQSQGIQTSFQLDSIKGKYEDVTSIYLTDEELDKISNTSFSSSRLNNAKDWLLISCYTGQRISDFMRFNKSMIREEDSHQFIEFKQVKTGKQMTVPIFPKVLDILSSRGGNFPLAISDQKYNSYIKEVCKQAGITAIVPGAKSTTVEGIGPRKATGNFEKWELVTSHIGRRSFATNLYGKVPTPYIMTATGHTTENMFLKYIGKTNTENAKQLANYFKLL